MTASAQQVGIESSQHYTHGAAKMAPAGVFNETKVYEGTIYGMEDHYATIETLNGVAQADNTPQGE